MDLFLQSLENSCNTFSRYADEKREQLIVIDDKFKILDKEVKRHINVPPTKHPISHARTETTSRAQTRHSRTRTAPVPKRTAQTPVIRPAPFPVKNYVLPAQHVIGPARYYNSAARKMKEREEEIERLESEKYPVTIPRPQTANSNDINLTITSTPIYPKRSSTKNEMDLYFDNI